MMDNITDTMYSISQQSCQIKIQFYYTSTKYISHLSNVFHVLAGMSLNNLVVVVVVVDPTPPTCCQQSPAPESCGSQQSLPPGGKERLHFVGIRPEVQARKGCW